VQLQERCTELNAQVSAHNASLAEIEENLDEASRLLEEKTSGENGLGTNSPIVRIKEAIRTLQEELNQMHITISILNNDLLQRRKEVVYNKKSSKKKSKKNEESTTFDDDV
jgi:predicted  nucleic acid-binding Zn-ribbon protein